LGSVHLPGKPGVLIGACPENHRDEIPDVAPSPRSSTLVVCVVAMPSHAMQRNQVRDEDVIVL